MRKPTGLRCPTTSAPSPSEAAWTPRPLTRKLADTGVAFDLALCSTAVRTRETWKLAVHEFPKRPKTVYEERIYEASPGELIALLNETPDDAQNVLLVGHNPGVQGLADILALRVRGRRPRADDAARLPGRRLRGPDLHRPLEVPGARHRHAGRLLGPRRVTPG